MSTDNITTAIELARSGDTGAFAQIVRQYQSLVSGVLFSATGDFHKSEDFAQETFLIAWQKLGELRETEHLAAWLCTIARNLVHRSHRKPTLPTTPLTDDTGGLATSGLASAAHAPPDAELIRKEQSEFVWSAIGEIDEKYRETLVLYYRSGQSVREIASATASTEEAVRQRLVRARKSLKVKLEEMVGNILTDTIPGETFTLTVMTALGATMLTTTVVQAAATGTIATGTAVGTKTTGTALGTATIWTVIGPVAYFGWFVAFFFGMLWAGVRNAPTLRSRRFRVYSIFWTCQYVALFCVAIGLAGGIITVCLPREWMTFVAPGTMIVTFLLGSLTLIPLQWANMRTMKRIIEDDLGLPNLCHRVESYSYQQVERRFFLSLVTNLLLAVTWFAGWLAIVIIELDISKPSVFIPMLIAIAVVALITAIYYPLGRYFLEICRTKQNFLAAPPLIDDPFETALMKSGKHHGSVDHLQKTGGMFGILLFMWLGIVGFGLWYFSWYSWDKYPIPLGICAFLLVALFVVQPLWVKRVKNQTKAALINILFFLCVAALFVCLECIEFGGFYFLEAWDRPSSQPENNLIRVLHRFMLFVVVLQVPIQFFYWRKANREERDDTKSGRDALLREAVERFDPATMTADEPEVAAKPFPRHWLWIIGLYAAAIVVMGCLWVLLR